MGFKLSSTDFQSGAGKPPGSQNPYDFDKNGLILPYPAFLSLCKDPGFFSDFMNKVESRYTEDTGVRVVSPASAAAAVCAAEAKKGKPSSKIALRRKYNEAFPELQDNDKAADDDDNDEEEEDDGAGDDDEDDDAGEEGDPEESAGIPGAHDDGDVADNEENTTVRKKRSGRQVTIVDYSEDDNRFEELANYYNESEEAEATAPPLPKPTVGRGRNKQQTTKRH